MWQINILSYLLFIVFQSRPGRFLKYVKFKRNLDWAFSYFINLYISWFLTTNIGLDWLDISATLPTYYDIKCYWLLCWTNTWKSLWSIYCLAIIVLPIQQKFREQETYINILNIKGSSENNYSGLLQIHTLKQRFVHPKTQTSEHNKRRIV